MDDVWGETKDWLDDFRPERMARFEVGPTRGTWAALGVLGVMALGVGVAWSLRQRWGKRLDVVPHFDIGRYLGTWYEIARYPNPMEIACSGATAHYSLRTDGSLVVVQRCRKDGQVVSARGLATMADAAHPAKLNIRFVGSLGVYAGHYWIIQLGPHYEYAVVSEPERRYLWILSRTPRLPDDVYRGILTRLQGQGFDTRRVVMTPQAGEKCPDPLS